MATTEDTRPVRTRAQVEADLARFGREWQALEARRDELIALRFDLWSESREVTPPIEHEIIGQYFGAGSKTVMKILRRGKAAAGDG